MKVALLSFLFAGFTFILQAQPLKRIYLANDDHTDYMWQGNEVQYDSAFVHMLDYYMKQIDSTKTNPDDFQARFNCDGSYWLKTYQKYRSLAQFDRLIGYIKSGHISSPLNSLVSVFGCQPAEAVLRGMFYAGRIERQYNLRFPMAIAMENQTLPMGLSSLWAGSGAKYSWKGVCECASRISDKRLSMRKHYIYQYTGPDDQRVLMKWYPHTRIDGGSRSLGGYAETRLTMVTNDVYNNINPRIPELNAMCDSSAAYPYRAAGAFGYGSDDLETFVSPVFIKVAQVNSTPERRVRVSNEEDFFRDIERNYKNIPALAVTYGNEWDLYPASMNETTAQVRRATEKLRSAESMATLVTLKDRAFGRDLGPARNVAWDAYGLYWEHDWTADGPVPRKERADWQIKQKNYITSYVDTLYNRASRALGALIPVAGSAHPRMYAYNPLSWSRSDVVDFAYNGNGLSWPGPVSVVDVATGKDVVSQTITKAGKSFVRIWAEDIPAVGYKVYELRPGRSTTSNSLTNAVTYQNGYLQNPFYRIRILNSGAIAELVDRRAGNRQVIEKQNTGASAGRWLNDLGSGNHAEGQLTVENAGAVSVTVKAVSPDPIPHTVRVTLFANSPRIEIQDSIQANFGDVKTWSFPFGLTGQTTRYEEVGAILTARKETRGGHYAAQNARYDWLTFGHFADLSEKSYGVTLSNQDCNFFQLGGSTADSLWENSSQLNALAGGQIDGQRLGILDQNGETRFQYSFALTTHQSSFDPAAAMRFSLEHQNPIVTEAVTGTSPIYPANRYSLLTTSDPGVLLWALKPAEDGGTALRPEKGVVARFWNVNNRPATPTITSNLPIGRVWKTSHIETDGVELKLQSGQLKPTFMPQQLSSFRLQPGSN